MVARGQHRLQRHGPLVRDKPMDWRGYLIFGICSLLVAFIGCVAWPLNLVTIALQFLVNLEWAPGGHLTLARNWISPINTPLVSLVWPLTLAPLHWLTYRVLKRRRWAFLGLFLLVNLPFAAWVSWQRWTIY
ncbi:MAG: hypothetical protein JO117_01185 [Verrucomicrobia bacterium]|nr:hypothetical protein [Verrucomicrobiota bacterium]MBV9656858.1 hypothetical protein [Verrucomicrobiota bacterium]